MKRIVRLACFLCFALLYISPLAARAAEGSPGEDTLYRYSTEKTLFQNFRGWLGTWGKGLFKPERDEGEDKKEGTLKRNLSLKEEGISKTLK